MGKRRAGPLVIYAEANGSVRRIGGGSDWVEGTRGIGVVLYCLCRGVKLVRQG